MRKVLKRHYSKISFGFAFNELSLLKRVKLRKFEGKMKYMVIPPTH